MPSSNSYNWFNKGWDHTRYTPGVDGTEFGDLANMLLTNWERNRTAAGGTSPGLSAAFQGRMKQRGRMEGLEQEFRMRQLLGGTGSTAYDNEMRDTRLGEFMQRSLAGGGSQPQVGRWGNAGGMLNQLNARIAAQMALPENQRDTELASFLDSDNTNEQYKMARQMLLASADPMFYSGLANRLDNAWSNFSNASSTDPNAGNFINYAKSLGIF